MLSAQVFNIRSLAQHLRPFLVRRPPQAGEGTPWHRQSAGAGGPNGFG